LSGTFDLHNFIIGLTDGQYDSVRNVIAGRVNKSHVTSQNIAKDSAQQCPASCVSAPLLTAYLFSWNIRIYKAARNVSPYNVRFVG
jgi:hypothetical protein